MTSSTPMHAHADADTDADYPPMVGSGNLEATQEIHIFMTPLNPSEEVLVKYYAAVDEWNRTVYPTLKAAGIKTEKMKACHLSLIFRKDGQPTEVCVMQSARYMRCNDPALVIEHCHRDAAWFKSHDLTVVREKIEATAYGINGIPLTDEEAQKYPKYFEFHIKVRRKDREDSSPISDEEVEQLKSVAVHFSQQYKVPVPLSFNKNKDKTNKDGKGHQRFLNLRFRQMGLESIKPMVKAVEEGIRTDTDFDVVKTISEYVWYDTYNEMDHGWIDFSPEEFQAAYGESDEMMPTNPVVNRPPEYYPCGSHDIPKPDENEALPKLSMGYMFKYGCQLGDIIAFSDYRDTESYIVGPKVPSGDLTLIENPDFSGSGYLTIPVSVTKYLGNTVEHYQDLIQTGPGRGALICLELRPNDGWIQSKYGVASFPEEWKLNLWYNWGDFDRLWIDFGNGRNEDFDEEATYQQIMQYYEDSKETLFSFIAWYNVNGELADKTYEYEQAHPLKLPQSWRKESGGVGCGYQHRNATIRFYGPKKSLQEALDAVKKYYYFYDLQIKMASKDNVMIHANGSRNMAFYNEDGTEKDHPDTSGPERFAPYRFDEREIRGTCCPP